MELALEVRLPVTEADLLTDALEETLAFTEKVTVTERFMAV